MGLLDFWKRADSLETRQDSSYTDTLVQLILSRAQAKSAVSVVRPQPLRLAPVS